MFQKKIKKLVESGWVDFPLRGKKIKNAKMTRMVQFMQKTQDLNFLLWGGQVKFSG